MADTSCPIGHFVVDRSGDDPTVVIAGSGEG
jgi:hypothetical protein